LMPFFPAIAILHRLLPNRRKFKPHFADGKAPLRVASTVIDNPHLLADKRLVAHLYLVEVPHLWTSLEGQHRSIRPLGNLTVPVRFL
jgi:hypothetical protein